MSRTSDLVSAMQFVDRAVADDDILSNYVDNATDNLERLTPAKRKTVQAVLRGRKPKDAEEAGAIAILLHIIDDSIMKKARANPLAGIPRIIDVTELKRIVVCNQRSYEVPKDVADELERLRDRIDSLDPMRR